MASGRRGRTSFSTSATTAGAHFFSDVVFAGVFSFLVIWLVHGLLYRWRLTRTTDAALEGTLERMLAWRPGKRR